MRSGAAAISPSRARCWRRWAGLRGLAGIALITAGTVGNADAARRPRQPALRFSGRLQVLSGVGFTLPKDAAEQRHFAAYVPVDVELATRLGGPLSLVLGGVAHNAPFSISTCDSAPSPRPHALGALAGLRLDFNNNRDGSWWSPWLALRAGLGGQAGVLDGVSCQERFVLFPYLSPRLGVDLWLGKAAVTFALGYDELPRASAVTLQLGLTLRLF